MTQFADDGRGRVVLTAPRRFVLVTGAGRSGTSTIAGALNMLGIHLPLPSLRTNRSNPKGFYESKWAIEFHQRVMAKANIDTFDARPEAWNRVAEILGDEDREEIEGWITEQSVHGPQIVVKDPRSTWMPNLWAEAAANVGFPISYAIMLRHPAEVIGSRSTYYARGDLDARRQFEVTSIARWVNANLIAERETRQNPRVFLRYYDLLDNWRRTTLKVRDQLDLQFNHGLTADEPHEVDDFIDPSLRRHHVTWDDLDIPEDLQSLAEATWKACGLLADAETTRPEVRAEFDLLSERYASMYRDASAIARDTVTAATKVARKKAANEARKPLKKKLAKTRAELAREKNKRLSARLSRTKTAAKARWLSR